MERISRRSRGHKVTRSWSLKKFYCNCSDINLSLRCFSLEVPQFGTDWHCHSWLICLFIRLECFTCIWERAGAGWWWWRKNLTTIRRLLKDPPHVMRPDTKPAWYLDEPKTLPFAFLNCAHCILSCYRSSNFLFTLLLRSSCYVIRHVYHFVYYSLCKFFPGLIYTSWIVAWCNSHRRVLFVWHIGRSRSERRKAIFYPYVKIFQQQQLYTIK